jgi:hypothetical protein
MALKTSWSAAALTETDINTYLTHTGGAFDTWTPTWSNLTVGNGTVTARYWRAGRFVICGIRVDFGSTTSITGSPSFTLPATAASTALDWNNVLNLTDTGSGTYRGIIRLATTAAAEIRYESVAGSLIALQAVSSSAPFTWTTGDAFDGTFIYEAAS